MQPGKELTFKLKAVEDAATKGFLSAMISYRIQPKLQMSLCNVEIAIEFVKGHGLPYSSLFTQSAEGDFFELAKISY